MDAVPYLHIEHIIKKYKTIKKTATGVIMHYDIMHNIMHYVISILLTEHNIL